MPRLHAGSPRRWQERLASLLELLHTLAGIILWRAGPRDLPASSRLVVFLSALYFGAGALEARIGYGRPVGFLYAFEDLALTLAVFSLLLLVTQKRHRLPQTLAAVLGTSLLFALPDFAILGAEPLAKGHLMLSFGLGLASLIILVWNLLAVAHIVRSALESTLTVGFAVAATYVLLSYLLAQATLHAGPNRGG